MYALGVTVYYAITGTLPPESIRVVMGKEAIKRPSELGIAIDSGVENALMKSLAVDKKKRYQDVQSMMNGLYNPRAPRKAVSAVTAPPSVAPKKTVVARTVAMVSTDKPTAKAEPAKRDARATATTATKPSATENAKAYSNGHARSRPAQSGNADSTSLDPKSNRQKRDGSDRTRTERT